ncbi:hypothetical protein F8388_008388, partial [Cannabis sativa]
QGLALRSHSDIVSPHGIGTLLKLMSCRSRLMDPIYIQLETGKKKFLPRIGSPLLYFTDSPDPTLSSISCADNHVHILKMPSMEILKSISGIKVGFRYPFKFLEHVRL